MTFTYKTIDDLLSYSKEAEGKYLYQIDKKNMFNNTNIKGRVGIIIEESFFGYASNSNAEADFADVGVELKTTGVIQQKNGNLAAKERLVLNIINYEKEIYQDFYSSSFWLKNNKILIFFYTYVRDSETGKPDYKHFQVIKTVLHTFTATDLEIIKRDWKIINNKIKNGLAHTLSEGDTNILGACTKGASAKSLRTQPFSDKLAKQRAYSLKQGYMSSLVRQYLNNEKLVPFTNPTELKNKSFEKLLHEYFDSYIGLNTNQIAKKLEVKLSNAKNKNALLVSSILGIKGTQLNKIEEFSKLNIKFKTVVVEYKGSIKESMSFENLNFEEIFYLRWENSSLKEKMESTRWLFVVFQRNKNKQEIFKGIMLWNVPTSILNNEIKSLYNEVKKLMHENNVIIYKNGKEKDNLPKTAFNGVCHVRPKGASREKSMITLPNNERIPNQCFWFNAKFVKDIVTNLLD